MILCKQMIILDWNNLSTIGLMGRVFANDPRDRDSIPARIIPKTQKMVLDHIYSGRI